MTMMTSASSQAVKGAVTAAEPMPSISAATDDAWQSRDAMVHVVGAEARAHELLHQVGLFVGTLGRAVTRQGAAAVPVSYVPETRGRRLQRLLPGGLPEMAVGIRRIDVRRSILGGVLATNQRHGEPVRVADVVEAEPALDAQAALVGRPVAALHRDDGVVLDPVVDLATHAAIGDTRWAPRLGSRACPRRRRPPWTRTSGRRWDRPARTRRRRRRCSRPWGRRSRRPPWRPPPR